MDVRVGIILVFVLGMTWACDARKLVVSGLSGEVSRNDNNVCTLCDKYVSLAFGYLEDNKTQTEIVEALHKRCFQIPPLKQQCLSLVDYFVPLSFMKLELIKPEELCEEVNLCETVVALVSDAYQDNCETCHQVVSEILIKLQDPETQLKIIRMLLKACKSLKDYEQQCKKMVFEYGPLILANADEFLEKTDVCSILHVCRAPNRASSNEGLDVTSVLSDS